MPISAREPCAQTSWSFPNAAPTDQGPRTFGSDAELLRCSWVCAQFSTRC